MALKNPRESVLRWLLALGCFAVLVFCFSPSWGAFHVWSRVPEMGALIEVRRGVSVLEQVAQPGAPLVDPIHRAIQWRLLFPLLARTLNLPSPLLFSLAHLGCLVVLGYIVAVLRRRGMAWRDTALATLVAGAASWFFTSTGWLGYFDSWLALALLIVAFAQHRWAVWAACVWAPWVDERFVVALPLALVCRYVAVELLTESAATPRTAAPLPAGASKTGVSALHPTAGAPGFSWTFDVAPAAALAAIFVSVRLGLLADRSGAGATVAGYFADQDFLNAPAWRIALGVWEGLRTGWLFVAAAIVLLWRRRAEIAAAARASSPKVSATSDRRATRPSVRISAAVLAGGVVVTAAVGLATAQDYSRSMTMLLPAVVLGLLATAPTFVARPRLLQMATLAALVLPAHHVMNDRINPIYYLYHELAALRSPPRAIMPEIFELEAVHDMERGEFARAHLGLTIAMKLASNPASPAKQRGILAASHQRWAEALRDFNIMVEHDPQNPEAWLMRAQAHLALGRARESRADYDAALALAPEGWSSRADVVRFLEKLNAAP